MQESQKPARTKTDCDHRRMEFPPILKQHTICPAILGPCEHCGQLLFLMKLVSGARVELRRCPASRIIADFTLLGKSALLTFNRNELMLLLLI